MKNTAGANAWRKVEGWREIDTSRKRKGNVLSSCITYPSVDECTRVDTMALTEKEQENVKVREKHPGKKWNADKRTIARLPYCRDVTIGVSSRQYGGRAIFVSGDARFQDGDIGDLSELKGRFLPSFSSFFRCLHLR